MPILKESSITLDFPDGNYFRWQDCAGYKKLSGNHFKEMDACWWDAGTNVLWLMELKDYTNVQLHPKSVDTRVWDMVKKAVDSLAMLTSLRHGYPYAPQPQLATGLPFALQPDTEFKFVSIIHCAQGQEHEVRSVLHDPFCFRFKPYAQLFDIKSYMVMEHSQAIQKLPKHVTNGYPIVQ